MTNSMSLSLINLYFWLRIIFWVPKSCVQFIRHLIFRLSIHFINFNFFPKNLFCLLLYYLYTLCFSRNLKSKVTYHSFFFLNILISFLSTNVYPWCISSLFLFRILKKKNTLTYLSYSCYSGSTACVLIFIPCFQYTLHIIVNSYQSKHKYEQTNFMAKTLHTNAFSKVIT